MPATINTLLDIGWLPEAPSRWKSKRTHMEMQLGGYRDWSLFEEEIYIETACRKIGTVPVRTTMEKA